MLIKLLSRTNLHLLAFNKGIIVIHREEHPVEVDAAGRERRVAAAAVHAAVRGLPVTAAGAARRARARARPRLSHPSVDTPLH